MIFKRALQRELISTAGGVFMTLFTITITIMLIRILGQAAGGKVDSADVIALIGFAVLNYLSIIVILTGFVSVLLVITRSYQDSEMVVWFASGVSLTQWIKPVMQVGFPIIAVTCALSFFVTPWANRQSAEFRERYERRDDVSKVAPGKFQESASANRVFFVEGVSGDLTRMKNVFVNSVTNDRNSIVVAHEGSITTEPNGDRFLVLHNGMRYENILGRSDFRLMDFERYSIVVENKAKVLLGDTSAKALPTMALLASTDNRFSTSELLWRIALPCMSVLLMLLAIPLSFVNPRVGRSLNLIIALLLCVTYNNLTSFCQAAVAQGRVGFGVAWWPVHLAVALITLALFLLRLNVNSRYHPLVLWSKIKRLRASAREPRP
ncbi:MAG: LPS export ABC transporter permease LptF [Burkholderiaceae bacterium]|nr:LPS export ABC transporter permease LptF [Burkholderiaceae bacterium]